MGSNCLMVTWFPLVMRGMFWNQREVMVAQHCECAKCHVLVHFKMVHLMLCDSHLKKKLFIEPKGTEEKGKLRPRWQGGGPFSEHLGPEGPLGLPGSGTHKAMRSEPQKQRGSVQGLAQCRQGPRDPTQSSLVGQQGVC